MKTFIIFSICWMLCFCNSSFAKIWRVNKNGGADFTDLQPAIDAASAGDTIQVEGYNSNGENYDFTCAKRLVFIGPGYLLTKNPKTQFNIYDAPLTGTFAQGSDGSSMMGFNIGSIYVDASNIRISRNYNGTVYLGVEEDNGTFTNDTIEQNYNIGVTLNSDNAIFSNLQINNNILTGMGLRGSDESLSNHCTGVFYNNIVYSSPDVSDFLVENNIINGDTTNIAATNVFKNNILNGSDTSPNRNGNFYVSDFTSIFVDWDDLYHPPSPGDEDESGTDGDAKLKAGSPAIGKGVGGVDLGVFSGANPYILSGMPDVPSVYQFAMPATITNSSTPVTVSIKSHN